MTVELFHQTSSECSRVVTHNYSTSFASAIRLLHADLRRPIYNIYGFVRLADEIVDSFHEHDKTALLHQFKAHTFDAIERGISLNPILNSFQQTVSQYQISTDLIEAFFKSMEADLSTNQYDRQGYEAYIYGSAESVGLMCLCVFCEGSSSIYHSLKEAARALGAAFQKVNFLRDIKADYEDLSRLYFPGFDLRDFSEMQKQQIEEEIAKDFEAAYKGILQLPMKARFGVYVAYKYYLSLFKKIKSTKPAHIMQKRIRIPNYYKAYIVFRAGVKNRLRLI